MTRTLSYTVTSADEGIRIDSFLAQKGLYSSRSSAVKQVESGRVFVNGECVQKKYQLAVGDFIVYEEEVEPLQTKLIGQPITLDIRYEDEHLLVLSKQAGLVCHPSPEHRDGTLVNALIAHCGIENLCNIQGEDDRLGIVHRLDMDTTGLMLAAKTNEAGEALMEAIRDRAIDRRYISLVHGSIAHDTGMVDAPIARSPKDRTKMTVRDSESARESITTFRVLERFEAGLKDNGYSLLECKLYTGRTHQIRVHMNYIKHPCVGDPLYGGGSDAAQLGLNRQFLHSYSLEFAHPITKEPMSFTDHLAPDLQEVLTSLNARSMGCTSEGEAVLALIK